MVKMDEPQISHDRVNVNNFSYANNSFFDNVERLVTNQQLTLSNKGYQTTSERVEVPQACGDL